MSDFKGGYIALARSLIADLRYRRPAGRPLTEIEALIWLICEVAWRPRALPTRFGTVHNERGQVSITERSLAKAWNWSKSHVRRYLRELAADETITLELRRPGPKSEAITEPIRGYPRTVITLRNYDKFQAGRRAKNQNADQKADQKAPIFPGLIDDLASEPAKHSNQESRKKVAGRREMKPRHGAKGRGMIWLDHGTAEWEIYAADYAATAGAQKLPENRIGGLGNWFVLLGEGTNKRRA